MGLRDSLIHETVGGLELRPLISVSPGTTVRACVEKMKEGRLGCVFVVDDAGKPIGKFTERRMMQQMVADPGMIDKPVSESMYDTVSTVTRDTSVADLIRLMDERQLRFVCVVDDTGKASALTGQKGVMEFIADHFSRAVMVQDMGSKVGIEEREGA